MTEKKKKGFWSWLGFGKSEAEKAPQAEPETDVNTASESEAETQIETASQQIEAEAVETAEIDAVEPAETTLETTVNLEAASETENAIESAQKEPEACNEAVCANTIEESVEENVSEQALEAATPVIEPEPNIETSAESLETEIETEPAQIETEATEAETECYEAVLETAESNAESAEANIEETQLEEAEAEAEPETEENETAPSDEAQAPAEDYREKPSKGGFFSRLLKGLIKTKQQLGSGFFGLFRGKKIDNDLFEELEEQLLIADLGMPTTMKIINNLTEHASRQTLKDAELLYQQLKTELSALITPVAQPLVLSEKKPFVILMVGVNGVGKTTTIGKLAHQFQAQGKSVMLAAGDTFRAAAVEQLQVWGERNNIPVIAQATGADSASVIFDAMQSASAKGIDVLIADTAGRLQNKDNLMTELKKIVKVMKKYDESAPHEIMLTLDAGTGQNAISQAKLFNEAVGITGITLTKLDGTAKGGVIFAIADQFKLPIRYIGIGEKMDDLRKFNAHDFIDALFTPDEDSE